ncbi:reverse transcriptase domain-containing protein [Pseudomonas sp. GT1P32]
MDTETRQAGETPIGHSYDAVPGHASALLRAVEPVVESRSDPRSYGFRPDCSTADAMVELFHLLAPQVAHVWILEGDIKGFFDHISHDWLYRNIPMDRTVLCKWLKAGVIDRGQSTATKAGTGSHKVLSRRNMGKGGPAVGGRARSKGRYSLGELVHRFIDRQK